jgi:CubicO group peptidase (beta-lactamase class C family)
MKKTALRMILAAAVVAGAIAQQAPPDLPETPAGRKVDAYVKAFNAGEAAIREYFLASAAKSALEKTPIDVRMNRYRDMKGRLGTITLQSLVEARADFVSVIAHTSDGPAVRMDFQFESAEPFGLLGIRIEALEGGGKRAESAPAMSPKKDDDELVAAVKQYGDRIAREDEFSGVILIAKGGKPIFEQAYGYADREKKIPNRVDTKFNIGSINKNFTSRSIRRLIAAGKIKPEDTIGKFLPDYPNKDAAARVTVGQLVSMTSGIGDFFGDRYAAMPKEKIRTLEDYLPLFADKPLEFEPGTKNRYSNGGYVVLGLIVAKASGRDYYDYVRENIFKPAGMNDTDSFPKDALPSNTALGYVKDGAAWKPNHDTLPGRGSSAGGGYSTAQDLLKYVVALSSGTLAATPEEHGSGLGIAGGAPGLNAGLEWFPDRGYAVIVLANQSPPAAERVARLIREWLPR